MGKEPNRNCGNERINPSSKNMSESIINKQDQEKEQIPEMEVKVDIQTQGVLRTQKTGLEKNITVQTSELEQSIEF